MKKFVFPFFLVLTLAATCPAVDRYLFGGDGNVYTDPFRAWASCYTTVDYSIEWPHIAVEDARSPVNYAIDLITVDSAYTRLARKTTALPTGVVHQAWVCFDTALNRNPPAQDMTVLSACTKAPTAYDTTYGKTLTTYVRNASQFLVGRDGRSLIRMTDTGNYWTPKVGDDMPQDAALFTKPVTIGACTLAASLFDNRYHFIAADTKYGASGNDTLCFYVDSALVGQQIVRRYIQDSLASRWSWYNDDTAHYSIYVGAAWDTTRPRITADVGYYWPKKQEFIGRIAGYCFSIQSNTAGYYRSYYKSWQDSLPKLPNVAVEATTAVRLQTISMYPNPASGAATLKFNASGWTTVKLLDVSGRLVKVVYAGTAFGTQEIKVDVRGLAAGRYFAATSGAANQVISFNVK